MESNESEKLGPESAAILLMALGEEEAAEVLKFVDPDEVQAIGEAMNSMAPISQSDIAGTLNRFAVDVRDQSSLAIGGDQNFQRLLIRALGKERAASVLSRIERDGEPPGLDALRWMPAKSVATVLDNEHPQVIAAVLSCLPRTQAAEVLMLLAKEVRGDVMARITQLDNIHPEAMQEIDNIIVNRLAERPDTAISDVGGLEDPERRFH